jgi:hypothetical protein
MGDDSRSLWRAHLIGCDPADVGATSVAMLYRTPIATEVAPTDANSRSPALLADMAPDAACRMAGSTPVASPKNARNPHEPSSVRRVWPSHWP